MAVSEVFEIPDALILKGDVANNFKLFLNSFTHYINAMNLMEEKAKIALFFSTIGKEAREVGKKLNISESVSLEDVISKFRQYCESYCANEVYYSYEFYKRVQLESEKFTDFLQSLYDLADKAKIPQDRETLIRNQIVVGLKNEDIRKEIFIKGLKNLPDIIKFCEDAECKPDSHAEKRHPLPAVIKTEPNTEDGETSNGNSSESNNGDAVTSSQELLAAEANDDTGFEDVSDLTNWEEWDINSITNEKIITSTSVANDFHRSDQRQNESPCQSNINASGSKELPGEKSEASTTKKPEKDNAFDVITLDSSDDEMEAEQQEPCNKAPQELIINVRPKSLSQIISVMTARYVERQKEKENSLEMEVKQEPCNKAPQEPVLKVGPRKSGYIRLDPSQVISVMKANIERQKEKKYSSLHFKCSKLGCDKSFTKENDLRIHMKQCFKNSMNKEQTENNENDSSLKNTFESIEKEYLSNARTEENDLEPGEKITVTKLIKCQRCGKCFTFPCRLRTHLMKGCDGNRKASGKPIYSCSKCKMKFRQKVNFIKHEQKHARKLVNQTNSPKPTVIKMHKCSFCKKSFTQTGNLKRHIVSVHLKKDLKLSFPKLPTHNKENNLIDNRKYRCDLCPRRYAHERSLTTHKKAFHNIKSSRSFSRKSSSSGIAVQRNKEKESAEELSEPKKAESNAFVATPSTSSNPEQKIFKCFYCNEQFTEKQHRIDHYLEKHKDELHLARRKLSTS